MDDKPPEYPPSIAEMIFIVILVLCFLFGSGGFVFFSCPCSSMDRARTVVQ